MQITGAELFLKALRYEQADLLFAYPGGQVIEFMIGREENVFPIAAPRKPLSKMMQDSRICLKNVY